MKILFAVPYVPSLVRVRPFNLLRQLGLRGHQVVLATVWTNEREREELEALRPYCAGVRATRVPAWQSLANCLRALPSMEPLQARYSWSRRLAAEMAALGRDVDLVHVEHLRGARYGLSALASPALAHAPVVWDSVDCISDLFEQAIRHRRDRAGRAITQVELTRTRRYEGALVPRFDRVLVTSDLDRQALLRLAGTGPDLESQISVLANGVDLDYFVAAGAPREAETLVFSGKMSYHANESAAVHLVREVMPIVWAERPNARLVIAGKDPSSRLTELAAAHAGRVTLTGFVNDIRPYLQRASVAVVPLVYGAGCQNKVLEAMACGTPVVATPRAVSALHAVRGRDVLVASGARRFAGAVIELLDNVVLQRSIGEAGRRYVEAHHRWDSVTGRLEAIYHEAVARKHAAALAS